MIIKDITEIINDKGDDYFTENDVDSIFKDEIIKPNGNNSRNLAKGFKFNNNKNSDLFAKHLKKDNRRLNDVVGSNTCCDMRDGFVKDCTGMCGKGCDCWESICPGDAKCCSHRGCWEHDHACRNCHSKSLLQILGNIALDGLKY